MALLESNCPNLRLVARGKVRDIYEFPGDDSKLLFVATDRISAFDIVMKNGIPNKGKLLTQLSLFFFKKLESVIPNHVISGDFDEILSLSLSNSNSNAILPYRDQLEGRTILVKKSQFSSVKPLSEVILLARHMLNTRSPERYMGSPCPTTWSSRLSSPSPSSPLVPRRISERTMKTFIQINVVGEVLGSETLANHVKKASIALYEAANDHCLSSNSGLFLADTKFEFGLDPSSNNQVLLIDECLTPDSSRFWAANQWSEGTKMSGFDKQVLRDWLKTQGVDGKDQLEIPKSVVDSTWIKYCEAFKLLTGREFVP
ncbi:hypothetical protein PSHT_12866 [Puccinia striiformis]|uniref:Phosphoribosylaminoimidazole-succinocarboxamide synthase n=1 Tax=Puccinia striiformis TaxID=27350 RepID=A0A2S4UUH6_9BASI|nr:hypothetical protein PSHT_12866 [Puccinia striiformis]